MGSRYQVSRWPFTNTQKHINYHIQMFTLPDAQNSEQYLKLHLFVNDYTETFRIFIFNSKPCTAIKITSIKNRIIKRPSRYPLPTQSTDINSIMRAGAGNQLMECLPSISKPWVPSPKAYKPGMWCTAVISAFRRWEHEDKSNPHPQLHNEFQISLSYLMPCHQN